MVKITEQLIRKKSEHNELIIGTLEELSLHQEDIDQIEHIQHWCRDLKILLLQSNLIAKIENLHKLKKLVYLNLALNNTELIENLEQLECLEKLDLTLNFIGRLTSVENLRSNYNLRQLFLTGNYCCNYDGYRQFVIVTLPQLKQLDGIDIKRQDQLMANRDFGALRSNIERQQDEQQVKRDEQKERVKRQMEINAERNVGCSEGEINERFWKESSEHCPEARIELANRQSKAKRDEEKKPKKDVKPKKLFADCGRPYNLNERKLTFTFEDSNDRFVLDLHVYRFLDTSLLDVDVQTNYVRVTVKGKIFQLALKEEVNITTSTSQRSLTTGHLLIIMPKLMPSNQTQLVEVKAKTTASIGQKKPVSLERVNLNIIDDEVPPLC